MATLQDLLDHPLTKTVDLSQINMADAVQVLRDEFGEDAYSADQVKPEVDALDFYMSNHVVALIRAKNTDAKRLTRAEQDLVERYVQRQQVSALRAFGYLLLICTREMRHLKSANDTKCKITADEKHIFDFLQDDLGHNGTSIANKVWSGATTMKLGPFCTVLEKMYRRGSWAGGFGGKAWAEVTLCLCEYVNGVYTAEMMIDTIWTLCHNNGPIFNKGMLFQHHGHELLRILDVQRAGQVPNFDWSSLSGEWYNNYLVAAIKVFPELMEDANIETIKQTALHSSLWSGHKYATPGLKTVKQGTHGEPSLITTKVKVR